MTRGFADLTHEVLDLDDRQREELLGVLLTSLDHADEIDRAWMDEARRRYEAIRSGKARTLTHDEVVARLPGSIPTTGSGGERTRRAEVGMIRS